MATTQQPPAYVIDNIDIVKSLSDGSDGTSASAVAKGRDAVGQLAKSLNFREELRKEIRKLADTVKSIERDFSTIACDVREIDLRKIIRNADGSERQFLSIWTHIHETYTSLMFASQKSAGRINNKISSFLHDLLPILVDDNVQLLDKQNSATLYIEGLEKFEGDGEDIAKRFLKLSQEIATFKINLVEAALKCGLSVVQQMKTLVPKIENLEKEMEGSSGFLQQSLDIFSSSVLRPSAAVSVGSLAGAGALRALVTETASASGLLVLAPGAYIALLAVGVGAMGYSIVNGVKDHIEKMKDASQEIDVLKEQLRKLQMRNAESKAVNKDVKQLEPVFGRLADRLSALHGIWGLIVEDARKLLFMLKDLRMTPDPLFFEGAVSSVNILYETLQVALESYVFEICAADS